MTQGEDGLQQAKKRGLEQFLSSQSSEGTTPCASRARDN